MLVFRTLPQQTEHEHKARTGDDSQPHFDVCCMGQNVGLERDGRSCRQARWSHGAVRRAVAREWFKAQR